MFSFPRIAITGIASLFLAGTLNAAPSCEFYPRAEKGFGDKEALTVPLADLESYIDGSELSEGADYDVSIDGGDIRLDLVRLPGSAMVASPMRTAWVIGRMASEEFDSLILVDEGEDIFRIDSMYLRSIGCQFIWGREGGENPIHLIRVFFDNLKWARTGERVIPPYTGSLLGDTQAALNFNNGTFVQEWVMSSVDLD